MIITADVYRIFADARQVHVVCTYMARAIYPLRVSNSA